MLGVQDAVLGSRLQLVHFPMGASIGTPEHVPVDRAHQASWCYLPVLHDSRYLTWVVPVGEV